MASLDNPSPSLRPRYRASPLLRDGPPLCRAPVLGPSQFPLLGDLPCPTSRRPALRHWPAVLARRQVPMFRTRARVELAPPLRRTPPGQSTGTRPAHPGVIPRPRFRCRLDAFDASSAVHSRSPSRLPPNALKRRAFSATLTTPALDRRSLRWFAPSPVARPRRATRPRRTGSSISDAAPHASTQRTSTSSLLVRHGTLQTALSTPIATASTQTESDLGPSGIAWFSDRQ
jgi:hypothetical protein